MESTRYHKGDKISGRYLVHQAHRGGMGEVYLCLDLEEKVPLALKTFQSRFFTSQVARDLFKQEVSYWIALEKHPHIVRCFYMGVIASQPFMFLEWITGDKSHGTDLRSWLRSGPLSLSLALQFTLDICFGLAHAQFLQPGIVHCDLKPDNILVAQGEVAKITDWGLATLVEQAGVDLPNSGTFETGGRQSLMQVGKVAGTPPYMAPEQWRGEKLDVRTDLYAVGCILYEMLTGHRPYVATSTEGFAQMHRSGPMPSLPPALPTSLSGVIARCLAKDAAERYQRPEELAKVLQGIMQEELGQTARVLPIADTFDATDYNNRGLAYANLGQYERSLQDFDRALALKPADANVYTNRGATYDDLGQYQQALQDYDHAIALKPDLAMAYVNRGVTYINLRQYERALQDFDRVLALKPNNAEAYYNRGVICVQLGRYERALHEYDRAIALKSDDARVYYNRGTAYANLGEFERALQDYDQVIALKPDYAEAYYNRGLCFVKMDHYERSLQDFDGAIALKLDYTEAYYSRGMAYINLGQYEQALRDCDRAIALNPDDATAYYNRGVSYAELGQYERAAYDYDCVLALQPDDAEVYFKKGLALVNTGALEEALACFEAAARMGYAKGARYAAEMRHTLEQPVVPGNPVQKALEAFQQAGNMVAMRNAVALMPLMTDPSFITALEQAVQKQVLPEHRPALQQRLEWLWKIADERS